MRKQHRMIHALLAAALAAGLVIPLPAGAAGRGRTQKSGHPAAGTCRKGMSASACPPRGRKGPAG